MMQCLPEAPGSIGPFQLRVQPLPVQQALWQRVARSESVKATTKHISRSPHHTSRHAPALSTRNDALLTFFP